jgi:hypothetical protein
LRRDIHLIKRTLSSLQSRPPAQSHTSYRACPSGWHAVTPALRVLPGGSVLVVP